MYAYAYSNLCIEYLFYAIRCGMRPHACIDLRVIERCLIQMLTDFRMINNKCCISIA